METKSAILILTIFLFSLAPGLVPADIGPSPSVDIYVTVNGQSVPDTTFKAKMLTCQTGASQLWDNDPSQLNINEYDSLNKCYWRPAKLVLGGDCQNGKCHFSYRLPSKFRLAVYLPSKGRVFLSDEVTRENFRSVFEANVLLDGTIEIQEMSQERSLFIQIISAKTFFIAMVLTLILELIVAFIYGSITLARTSKKLLSSVSVANIISLPIVWFIFPLLRIKPLEILLLGELFVFVFEGYFIHWLNRDILTLKRSFVLSILMNLASLVIGGFIFLFLWVVFYA